MKKITVTREAKASTKDLYGIFFEDINHAADGGIYGELLRNRAFEFSPIDNGSYNHLTGWTKIELGGAKVSNSITNKGGAFVNNPDYLVMSVENAGTMAGIKNTGFNSGIPLEAGKNYRFSCYAKAADELVLTISFVSAQNKIYSSYDICVDSNDWKKYELVISADETDFGAHLAVTMKKTGKVCLDFVSLFPEDTWNKRENGLRKDLVQKLYDLKPAFVRFPGGCLVHDGTLNSDDRNSAYRWKNTLGPVTERPARRNNWGYNQSLGLGYFEYFTLCEDIGAKALPVIPAGYNPHMQQAAPLDEMTEWVDEALDLIEFANGDTDTEWGAIRASLGHEKPFELEYLAIGNEEVGTGFWDRYDIIHKAVREKYPNIKLINSAGPFPCGLDFERGWENARKNGSDLVDEHYYVAPEWMLANMHRYDEYPAGPMVFLGEYGTWGSTWYNALVEAAYMTGLENNADKVGLACYAPLFCNADYVNWQPDLIWFDNHRSYGTANYYVQQMFMQSRGENLLKTEAEGLEKPVVLGSELLSGSIAIAADNCRGKITDIVIRDGKTGIAIKKDDITLLPHQRVELGDTSEEDFTIEMTLTREFGGYKGFVLHFADDKAGNEIRWLIGGWQNQDTELSVLANGRGFTLHHKGFSLTTGVSYKMRLEVHGREVSTYIDGVLENRGIYRRPQIEDLYFSATEDDKNIYLKVVNVKDEAVTSCVEVENVNRICAEVLVISGELTAINSFDNPTLIAPEGHTLSVDSNDFEFVFDKNSVTLFKIEK